MLCMQLFLILTKRDFGAMLTAERRAMNEGKLVADDADTEQVSPTFALFVFLFFCFLSILALVVRSIVMSGCL